MHQVIRSVREILLSELPKVRDMDGVERPATDAELLNMGLARIRGDYFSCVELHVGPDSSALAPERKLPGTVLSVGELRDRYRRLPVAVKNRVMRARVLRAKDPTLRATDLIRDRVLSRGALTPAARRSAELEEARAHAEIGPRFLFVDEIDPDGDVVEELDVIPHAWAGE